MECEVPFDEDDASMILRENDIPICDECAFKEIEIEVEYDGRGDSLDHSKKHVGNKKTCTNCGENQVELKSIEHDNPIDAHIKCNHCDWEDIIYIELKMI